MMQRQSNKIELLAPAGDLARAKTAIRYGADAVYLGGMNFSLRSRASNFTMEDIREACAFAKEHGAAIHVTVNIIPHDDDFEGLEEYLQQLEEAGVTAIITASMAIMKMAKVCAPKLQVHCSTQLSLTNSRTARFLVEEAGVDRVVLARECTLEEVKKLTAHCPVETEAFIHGGMCVNYSGRCTLSNRMTLRDANRGGCAQSCRWQYDVYAGEEKLNDEISVFTMGSKDLMAADVVGDLIKAGVSSLKIEGRMKTEYYVASVVSGYRHLIDDLYANNMELSEERMAYHKAEIMKGENREVCPGFYNGTADASSIIYHANSNTHVSHDFLGTVLSYEDGMVKILTRNPVSTDMKIEVLAPGCENRIFTPEWLENDKGERETDHRNPMTVLTMPIPFAVEKNDILRRAG